MNGSLFWLLLRYAELVNPNAIVKSAPAGVVLLLLRMPAQSGDASGAEESCAFLALGQLDGDIEQIHYRHGSRCRLAGEFAGLQKLPRRALPSRRKRRTALPHPPLAGVPKRIANICRKVWHRQNNALAKTGLTL